MILSVIEAAPGFAGYKLMADRADDTHVPPAILDLADNYRHREYHQNRRRIYRYLGYRIIALTRERPLPRTTLLAAFQHQRPDLHGGL